MILVSVYDKKSCEFAPCYCVNNIAVACRSFENTVKQGDNDLHNYPEDFQLVKVGTFEDGVILGCEPDILMEAVSCFPKKVQEQIIDKKYKAERDDLVRNSRRVPAGNKRFK